MQIKSIQASSFGCLQDWEIKNLDTNLVVIYGHNEAGKSTFFHLIETLFYGWQPVKNNPYLPWEGNKASIAAGLVQQNGAEIIVQRSLRNQAQGEVIKGEISINLRNKSLEMLAFLPRAIFSEVYFLTLEQLRFPDTSAWQELQDQLLGGQFTSFLKPVSAVVSDLEDEASSLWRPDRRGKPEAKRLQEEILELTQHRKKALENEQNLRDKEQQLFNLEQEQEQIKEKRIRLSADLNRAERLLPVKKKLQRIAVLETEVGNLEEVTQLPEDPQKSIEKIVADLKIIDEKIERTGEKKEQYTKQLASFGKVEQLFIEQADEIGKITKAYSLLASDQQEISTLQGELRQNKQRLVDYATTFLLGGYKLELETNLKSIDEVELQAEIASFKEVHSKYQNKSNQLEGLRGQRGSSYNLRLLPPIAITFFLLGLLGIVWLGNSPLGFASALLLILGLGLGVYGALMRGKKFKAIELKRVEQEVAALKAEEQQRRDKVKATLQGLSVAERRLRTPDETLWVDVKNMKIYVAQKVDLTEKLNQVKERLSSYEKRVHTLLEVLKCTSAGDLLADLRKLETGLTMARECKTKAEHAESNLREAEEQLVEWQSKKEKLIEEKELLLSKIESLPGENLREKIDTLFLWRDYAQQVQTLRQDLAREYPDLKAIEREIAEAEAEGETWLFSDYDLATKKIVLSEVEERDADLKEEKARLETELKHLAEQERIDDLTGAIQQLQAERERACVKRDRLIFLKSLLKEADRSFREKHQPDVLQKAGYYLEKITAGRYNRLFVQDNGRGLIVRSNYTNRLLRADFPLSRRTLEQIYLALRLALA
ncbi:MAG: AAA family ATPase [Clostridia bacterium]|nr:AAA family ATPase [Clostridia bacterium]